MGNTEKNCSVGERMEHIDPMAAVTCNDVIALDKDFYDWIIAEKANRKFVREEVLRPFTGDAYFLRAGQVIRIEQREARTQIVDLMFVTPDLKQYGDNGNSSIFEGMVVDTYKRVWSQLRYTRPMATMIANEVPSDWVQEEGERVCPHFWGAHCSPEWLEFGLGREYALKNTCHINFLQAINKLPAIHAIKNEAERRQTCQQIAENENINLFQPCSWRGLSDPLCGKEYPAPPLPYGTGVEFYAEQDVYVLLSNCSLGDQSASVITDNVPVPVYVSVYDTGIKPKPAYEIYDWETEFYEMIRRGEKDISIKNDRTFF